VYKRQTLGYQQKNKPRKIMKKRVIPYPLSVMLALDIFKTKAGALLMNMQTVESLHVRQVVLSFKKCCQESKKITP
jgi:hypothetical protein